MRRESGRMVGVYPELEGEVVWRMEHLMAKWDMLASLRNKARTNTTDLPDVYSGIKKDGLYIDNSGIVIAIIQ